MAKPAQKPAAEPEGKVASAPALTLIKVIRPFHCYSPGDITGFSPDKAQELIDGGLAEPYTPAEGEE